MERSPGPSSPRHQNTEHPLPLPSILGWGSGRPGLSIRPGGLTWPVLPFPHAV